MSTFIKLSQGGNSETAFINMDLISEVYHWKQGAVLLLPCVDNEGNQYTIEVDQSPAQVFNRLALAQAKSLGQPANVVEAEFGDKS